jgi:hypothetical protein
MNPVRTTRSYVFFLESIYNKHDSSINIFSFPFISNGQFSSRHIKSGNWKRRWVDNIKMDLRKIGWDGMDWIDLAQDTDQWRALVNMLMNLRVP